MKIECLVNIISGIWLDKKKTYFKSDQSSMSKENQVIYEGISSNLYLNKI